MNRIITILTNKAFSIMLTILLLVAACVLFSEFLISICIFISKILATVYNFIQTTPFFSKNLFNFLLVVAFFVWLSIKFDFIGLLDKKKDEIINLIRHSENEKENSKNELNNTANSLQNIDNDVKKIVDDAKNIAKSIETKSQEKLNEEISNLDKRAEKLKQGYENKAKVEVSQKIANASIAISKHYIENSLDENMHKELIYNFINNLDNMRVE